MSSFVIDNANIFTGDGFKKGSVTVQDSKIQDVQTTGSTSVPSGIDVVDATDKYLIPGLIDSHIHMSKHGEPILIQMAKHGVTTALDMGTWPPENWKPYCGNERSVTGNSPMCDLRSAGAPATVPGTLHHRIPGLDKYVVTDPTKAAEWVSTRVAEGSHYIKVIADVPVGPSQELLNDLVNAAHKEGKLVVAHAARNGAFAMAVKSDADVLTHVPTDAVLDDETLSQFVNSRSKQNPNIDRFCVPTMSILKAFSVKFGPPHNYEVSVKSLAKMHKAGIPIVAGTDANLNDGPVPIPHGEALHSELELMLEAGISNLELLQSATTMAGKYFGGLIGDRGSIEVGKRADLVLLNDDPLKSITNTKKIEKVWIEGREVDRT